MYHFLYFLKNRANSSDIYVLLVIVSSVLIATVIALYGARRRTRRQYIKHNKINKAIEDDCNQNSDNEFQKDGFISKIKTSLIKEVEGTWTDDELQEESQIQREQLAAIFELLKKQESELNTKEINELELTKQLSLYH